MFDETMLHSLKVAAENAPAGAARKSAVLAYQIALKANAREQELQKEIEKSEWRESMTRKIADEHVQRIGSTAIKHLGELAELKAANLERDEREQAQKSTVNKQAQVKRDEQLVKMLDTVRKSVQEAVVPVVQDLIQMRKRIRNENGRNPFQCTKEAGEWRVVNRHGIDTGYVFTRSEALDVCLQMLALEKRQDAANLDQEREDEQGPMRGAGVEGACAHGVDDDLLPDHAGRLDGRKIGRRKSRRGPRIL
jgi:hypothetical protein